MSKLILFSKCFKDKKVDELIDIAADLEVDGYDLCLRPGYAVNPDNVGHSLVDMAKRMRAAGMDIPMITGNFDLLLPDHPQAEVILKSMDKADIRLLKLGYFSFDPYTQDYWAEVHRIRKGFKGWEELGRKHSVKICYHTHSHQCMGLNASALAHLLRGFDPQYLGAYLDPCHLVIEGEEFAVAVNILRDYLSIVALKDVLITREETNGHGRKFSVMTQAGAGNVDWTAVFADLARIGFDGPLSVHCEFEVPDDEFLSAVKREVQFFRQKGSGTFRMKE